MKFIIKVVFTAFIITIAQSVLAAALSCASPFVTLPVHGVSKNYIIPGTQSKRGVLIEANQTEVSAPIGGQVYFVGHLVFYRNTIIIANKHNLVVIGGLDDVIVQKGMQVEAGQTLGTVPYNRKLLFEIRDSSGIPLDVGSPLLARSKSVTLSDAAYSRLASLLESLNYPHHLISTFYCIAKWESNLNPRALNYNKNSTIDVGLFQINSIWFKECNVRRDDLFDTRVNAECALKVWQKQGFDAWTTYRDRKILSF